MIFTIMISVHIVSTISFPFNNNHHNKEKLIDGLNDNYHNEEFVLFVLAFSFAFAFP